MPYTIITPFQDASPGVFPAQAQVNWQRLRDIINADHLFTDSSDASQGIHKQCTMINRADPGSLPIGSGILYSKNDTNGNAQLNWYNGNSIVQMTPGVQMFEGTTASLALNAFEDIFPDPGYSYQATCWLNVVGSANQRMQTAFLIQPGGINNSGVTNITTSADGAFTFNSTNILKITNTVVTNRIFKWAIQVSRLT